jgi:hypothetical protein
MSWPEKACGWNYAFGMKIGCVAGIFGKEGSIIRAHKVRHSRTLPLFPGVVGANRIDAGFHR